MERPAVRVAGGGVFDAPVRASSRLGLAAPGTPTDSSAIGQPGHQEHGKRAPHAPLCLSIDPGHPVRRRSRPTGRAIASSARTRGMSPSSARPARCSGTWPNAAEVHDIALLPNGNVLFQTSRTRIVEMTPGKKVAWEYESKPKAGYNGRVEVHAFRRLPDGLTMIAESGNRRIIEVDSDGKIVHEIPLTVDKPDPHRDTRMVRKLDNGHYLVCHEGDGKVREYDGKGKVVWTYALDLAGRPRPRPRRRRRTASRSSARSGSTRRQHAHRLRQRQPGDRGQPRRQGRLVLSSTTNSPASSSPGSRPCRSSPTATSSSATATPARRIRN